MRFQQLTGPAMAKGLEDTAFYNYNRLISLNEVGGDPGTFGTSIDAFHQHNSLIASERPNTLLATATHDTNTARMRVPESMSFGIPDRMARSGSTLDEA